MHNYFSKSSTLHLYSGIVAMVASQGTINGDANELTSPAYFKKFVQLSGRPAIKFKRLDTAKKNRQLKKAVVERLQYFEFYS